MTIKATYKNISFLLLLLYTVLQVYCINQLTPNYDERSFAGYGISMLKLQKEKDVLLYESKLPITALNMIPRAVEQVFNPGLEKGWQESGADITAGRYVSLLAILLLGLLVYRWTRQLYSEKIALVVLCFYLLCPNFLAYGVFVSSDVFACLFMTAAFYFLWRYNYNGKLSSFIWMSIASGLAQISKFAMVHLLLIIPALLLILYLHKRKTGETKSSKVGKPIAYAAIFLFSNWFIISAAHFFYQTFIPLSDFGFMSGTFRGLQEMFPWLPAPLPSSYISSMDAVIYFDKLGGGVSDAINGEPYILNESNRYGFWYYYFVAIFYKTPIPTLIIWMAGLVLPFSYFNKARFFRNDIFLLFPIVYFLIYLDFFYSTQLGIRHIMIIFPLLFILSGEFISRLLALRNGIVCYLLLAWLAVSVLRYAPHFLPYTNEFISNKKMAYRKLADSNLCYGEGKKFLHAWLEKNKDAIYMPAKPTEGKIVMEINEMLNLNIRTMGKYDWVRPLTPVDHIHSQYLVFDVPNSFIDSLKAGQ